MSKVKLVEFLDELRADYLAPLEKPLILLPGTIPRTCPG
jgi:hypothetical protein